MILHIKTRGDKNELKNIGNSLFMASSFFVIDLFKKKKTGSGVSYRIYDILRHWISLNSLLGIRKYPAICLMQTCNNKTVNFSTLPAALDNDQIKRASLVHELTYSIRSNIPKFQTSL